MNLHAEFGNIQNTFEIKIFECIRSPTVMLIPNIKIEKNRKNVFQFLPAKAASSSLSDPYCNAMVIADKRSPWADLLLLGKRSKKPMQIKKRVITLTISSHSECVSKREAHDGCLQEYRHDYTRKYWSPEQEKLLTTQGSPSN